MMFNVLSREQAILIAFLSSILVMSVSSKAAGLTLEEAYRLALENYETVKIARESLLQAEMEKRKALSGLLPTLKSELDYTRRPGAIISSTGTVVRPQGDEKFQLTLDQPLFSGGQATSAYRIAGLG